MIFNFMKDKCSMTRNGKTGRRCASSALALKQRFFPTENAIGKSIKVGPHWLTIIGVMRERLVSQNSISKLGIRDFNMDVYAPLRSVLIRYENRDLITAEELRKVAMRSRGNVFITGGSGDEDEVDKKNYHQLDRLVIQVGETEKLQSIAERFVALAFQKAL